MTREILIQGQEIVEELEKLFEMKDNWEKALEISEISLYRPNRFARTDRPVVDRHFIDFEDLRLKVLEKIEKRISELQEKFYKL